MASRDRFHVAAAGQGSGSAFARGRRGLFRAAGTHVAGGKDTRLRGLQARVGRDEAALVNADEVADQVAVGREPDEDADARGRELALGAVSGFDHDSSELLPAL